MTRPSFWMPALWSLLAGIFLLAGAAPGGREDLAGAVPCPDMTGPCLATGAPHLRHPAQAVEMDVLGSHPAGLCFFPGGASIPPPAVFAGRSSARTEVVRP